MFLDRDDEAFGKGVFQEEESDGETRGEGTHVLSPSVSASALQATPLPFPGKLGLLPFIRSGMLPNSHAQPH